MKIWEAILYGILGGLTEILPISFTGHATVFSIIFALSPLTSGEGLYISTAINLGIILAIFFAFRAETSAACSELRAMMKKRSRVRRLPLRRSIFMGLFALFPMLLSLIFYAAAERITRLLYIALFFALNGFVMILCSRRTEGQKDERTLMLPDALLLGTARMLAVFPGLSGIGAALSVGHARGLSGKYNLRFCFLLSLPFYIVCLIYRLIRAIAFGRFISSLLLPMLLAMLLSTIMGYFSIQYLKYLYRKNRFNFFAYYCWDAAVIVLILALINA